MKRTPLFQITTPNFEGRPIPDGEAWWMLDVGPHIGRRIQLLTPGQLAALPDGVELVSISDVHVVKGRDRIDDDTRFGRLAYGFESPTNGPT